MEQLASAAKDFADRLEVETGGAQPHPTPGGDAFRAAAAEWSRFCLATFRGDVLRAGLGVSAAIADFLAELEAVERVSV